MEVFNRVVVGPGFQIRIVLLCEYAVECGLHVINSPTSHHLSNLLNMILDLDVVVLPTMRTVNRIVENIAIKPLGIIKRDIKGELLFSTLLSNSNMTNLTYLLSIELIRRTDLGLISLQHHIRVIIVLTFCYIIVRSDGHVEIILMGGPFNDQDRGLADHVDEHVFGGVDE